MAEALARQDQVKVLVALLVAPPSPSSRMRPTLDLIASGFIQNDIILLHCNSVTVMAFSCMRDVLHVPRPRTSMRPELYHSKGNLNSNKNKNLLDNETLKENHANHFKGNYNTLGTTVSTKVSFKENNLVN